MTGIVQLFDDLQYHRALWRERVFGDPRYPVDIYDDVELYDCFLIVFLLNRDKLLELTIGLRDDLQHSKRRQRAPSPEI